MIIIVADKNLLKTDYLKSNPFSVEISITKAWECLWVVKETLSRLLNN